MPKTIARHHNEFLKNFIENEKMNILKSDNRVLFLKNRSKFIHPIIAKIKLETSRGLEASCLLIPINNGCQYLLVNKKGLIEELSEGFFDKLFKK